MKKLLSVLIFVSLLSSCSKQTAPMTYEELLRYKGTNENLYKYIMLTAIENEQLFDKWFIVMSDMDTLFNIKTEKAALLYLFSQYYQSSKDSPSVKVFRTFSSTQRRLLESMIENINIPVSKEKIDELTDFFFNLLFTADEMTAAENDEYEKLMKFEGTNENLYRYILLTATENKPLYDKWTTEMSNYTNIILYNPERVVLLDLFSRYYQMLELTLNSQKENKISKKDFRAVYQSVYTDIILDTRELWENTVNGLNENNAVIDIKINVKKSDIDELTNLFLALPYE